MTTRRAGKPSGFWHGAAANVTTPVVLMARVKIPSPFARRRHISKRPKPIRTDPLPDSLTPAESALLDEAIESNKIALITATSPTSDSDYCIDYFDTTMPDERSLNDLMCSHDPLVVSKVACASRIVTRASLSDLKPILNTKGKQYPLSKAVKFQDLDRLKKSTAIEIDKLISTGCCSPVPIPSLVGLVDYLIVHAHVLYKLKADGRDTCRIAGMGNRIMPDPDIDTFSPVSKEADRMLSIAMMQAHCASLDIDLNMVAFDVMGAFLRCRHKSSKRMFLLLPHNLPHPLAGQYLEVFGALYGLRESNKIFQDEANAVCVNEGFVPSSVAPMTYVKTLPSDPSKKCVLNTVVDDFLSCDNCPELTNGLFQALKARFTDITSSDSSPTFSGIETTRLDNHGILLSQTGYIARVADTMGISHLEQVDTPVHSDFFIDPTPSPAMEPATYQKLTGHLVQTLKTRDDVRHFVSFLCSKNQSPTNRDYEKAIHLLRYLHSTPLYGRTFNSKDATIFGFADSSHATLPDGRSPYAYFLCVGSHNAPFFSDAKSLDDIATCPFSGEYMAASNASKHIIHFRQLASDITFPQMNPTVIFSDNDTAIKLLKAPEISRKAKHIFVSYHFVRELVKNGVVTFVFVTTDKMRANVITKYLMRQQSRNETLALLNIATG